MAVFQSPFPQITSPPQTAAEVLVNEALETLKNSAVYGKRQSATSGLIWGYYGGRWGSFAIADGTLTLTANATNYIVVKIADGTISVSTATTNWNDATNYARTYAVTTNSSGVVASTGEADYRAGPGGIGGGSGGGAGAPGAGYLATSTTSLTIGTGSKAFTTQSGLAYSVGARVRATSRGAGSYMEGLVSAYSGTTLTITMDLASGSGIQADWNLNVSGNAGSAGAAGAGYAATSTTSLVTAGTGSKTFTTQAGLAYSVGARIRATSVGTAEYMEGVVTSYTGTSLVVTMDTNSGTGTHADWNINLAGNVGATGAAGSGFTGGTLTSALNEAPTVTIASAATVAIGAAAANTILISGTTAITAFDTIAAGAVRRVRFGGALTLTYNATSLILPTSANITTAADDTAEFLSLGSGNWFCLRYDRKSGSALVGAGLSNITESFNTAAPNATVYVEALSVSGSSSSVDLALVVKGSGALIGGIPDSTTAGGNKRGASAVDLQLAGRASNTRIASGSSSVLVGGSNNTASGNSAAVIGGGSGIASGDYSVVLSGQSCQATNTYSVAYGQNAIASGNSSKAGGYNVTASGQNSHCWGIGSTADALNAYAMGNNAFTRGVIGAFAYASYFRAAQGDNQRWHNVQSAQSTSTTAVLLTTNAATAAATNQILLPTGSALKVRAQVVGRATSSGDAVCFDITGLLKNVGGTVTVVGTPTVTQQASDTSLTACTCSLVADNTNKCAQISVVGIAATTINWAAEVQAVQLV